MTTSGTVAAMEMKYLLVDLDVWADSGIDFDSPLQDCEKKKPFICFEQLRLYGILSHNFSAKEQMTNLNDKKITCCSFTICFQFFVTL